MAYKTILTVLTGERQDFQLDAALHLAASEDAHLDVLCLGVDRSQTGYYYAGATGFVMQEAIDRAMDAASAIEAQARARLEGETVRWSLDSVVAQAGGVSAVVGMRARFADLAVMSRPYGPGVPPDAESAVEAAMFEGGCPVMVLPEGGLPEGFDRRILIAWNQSSEALCAVRRALPLIRRAEAVEIAVIDPSPNGPERSDPGVALCQMLTRHGARADVAILAKTLPRTSDIISRRAVEIGATMIVMGAYGHSRFREAILGGTTRNMLEMAEIPVLMAR
ncbi:universal stress protein [Paracoccus suum]|uniref:Universal stress protein n=1 Tax=Paracoccus suum TaxID=2259340 RepID=A0A344PMM2_9RHOB|nr:universal stress protein [Paracoccus suum]AXC50627.1 universal stress protein [Paracoccus suum]